MSNKSDSKFANNKTLFSTIEAISVNWSFINDSRRLSLQSSCDEGCARAQLRIIEHATSLDN